MPGWEQGQGRVLPLGREWATEKGEVHLGYGWGIVPTSFGTAYAADGSGGTFYARIGLLPDKGMALVALSNAGHAQAAIADAQRFLTSIR